MPRSAINRGLTGRETEVLSWLVENGLPSESPFRGQATRTTVVGHCSCGCGTIDLAVDGRRPDSQEGLDVLVDAVGVDPAGHDVAVILFGRKGQLTCLEVYSPAGIDGVALPTVDSMRLV